MKNLVVSFVLFLVSFFGFSQNDSSFVDLTKVSPKLFSPCDDSTTYNSKIYYIPLSTDSIGIQFFKTSVESNFTVNQYKATLILYNNETEYISDIWVGVFDGNNEIQLPLCSVIRVFNSGELKTEYTKVFNVLNEKIGGNF